jgi:xylulokinase
MSILVFDAGSSALKALLFSDNGAVLARAEAAYPEPSAPHRRDPEGWWRAAVAASAHLPLADVRAIALSGTMENLIPVDAGGRALGDAHLYSDPCGAPFLQAIDVSAVARIAGNAAEPLMTALKLAALRADEPARFADACWFLPGSKDFLALRLTGLAVTDPTCAATTGLMALATRTWSPELLALIGVDAAQLPAILPATAIVGPLLAEAATALGLPPGIPVINGCGDGGATTVGGAADQAGDVSLYLGTTGWVAHIIGADAGPSNLYLLPHPLHGGLIEIAPILSAGAAAQWARTAIGLTVEAADAAALAADAEPGTAVFLPYLNGERFPFVDLDVRGSFVGLTPADGPGQLYRAVLEGVAFAIQANLDAMGGAGAGRVSLVGGGALSAIWPQILADVLDRPIETPADPVSATSFGALRIALAALGLPDAAGVFAIAARPRSERAHRTASQRQRFALATSLIRQFN